MARINHFAENLHPRAAAALERVGLRLPVLNPYRSIIVRAIGPQWMGATVVDLEEGRLDDFVLEVAPAVPVTIWTRAGALDPVSFEITDAQGTRLEVVTTRRPKHLIHLSAGTYTIRWGEGLDRSRKKALTVGSEPTDVRLGR